MLFILNLTIFILYYFIILLVQIFLFDSVVWMVWDILVFPKTHGTFSIIFIFIY